MGLRCGWFGDGLTSEAEIVVSISRIMEMDSTHQKHYSKTTHASLRPGQGRCPMVLRGGDFEEEECWRSKVSTRSSSYGH